MPVYDILPLEPHGDKRGKLISLESFKNIPFDIKRIYYIYDTAPEWVRGKHAHPHLEQIAIAIDGACDFLLDDGLNQVTIRLDRPDKGLYIGRGVWREMHNFSYGCKLLVLANNYYDPDEYIRDYDVFLQYCKQNKIT